jgi:hypothetical protein
MTDMTNLDASYNFFRVKGIIFPQDGGFETYRPMLAHAKTREEFDLIPKNISRQEFPDHEWVGRTNLFNVRILHCDEDFDDAQELVHSWENTDLVAFFKERFPMAFRMVKDEGLHALLSRRLNIHMNQDQAVEASFGVRFEGQNQNQGQNP